MNIAQTSFLLPIASLVALTVLAWLVSRTTRVAICPVCFGVSATWLWMVAARLSGVAVDDTMLAILVGASVVGGTQWVDGRLPRQRSSLLWKALALPTGFAAAYGLVAQRWALATAAAVAVAMLAALFLRSAPSAIGDSAAIAQLEEQMKKCC